MTEKSLTELAPTPTPGRLSARFKVFLAVFGETGSVTKASAKSGISRQAHYAKLTADPEYRAAFEAAGRQIGENVQAGVVDRAINGTKRQLFYQGEPIVLDGQYAYETDYDNQLSLTVLRHYLPEWRERNVQDVNISISLTQRMEEANQRLIEMYPDD